MMTPRVVLGEVPVQCGRDLVGSQVHILEFHAAPLPLDEHVAHPPALAVCTERYRSGGCSTRRGKPIADLLWAVA